jgi:uncharacterized integral membrane protein
MKLSIDDTIELPVMLVLLGAVLFGFVLGVSL